MEKMSKCRLSFLAVALGVLVAGFAVTASAQTARVNLQSLDERVLAIGRPDRVVSITDQQAPRLVPGRANLFAAPMFSKTAPAAAPNKPTFSFGAQVGGLFTSNAYRSGVLRRSDRVFTPSVNADVDMKFGDTTLKAGVEVSGERYDENSDLDGDAFAASLGIEHKLGDWRVALGYSPTLAYDVGFGAWQATFHAFTADLRRSYPAASLGANTSITPSITLTRVQANPSDFDSSKVTLGAGFRSPIGSTDLAVSARLVGSYQRYDNFFGRHRNDATTSASLTLAWSPNDAITVAGSVSALRNWSNLSNKRYNRFDAIPAITLAASF